jgi:hypothetical protein
VEKNDGLINADKKEKPESGLFDEAETEKSEGEV